MNTIEAGRLLDRLVSAKLARLEPDRDEQAAVWQKALAEVPYHVGMQKVTQIIRDAKPGDLVLPGDIRRRADMITRKDVWHRRPVERPRCKICGHIDVHVVHNERAVKISHAFQPIEEVAS